MGLPGAALPQREQPIFEHLAATLAPLGFAVLTFDRQVAEGDTPLGAQADEALRAAAVLSERLDAPVGLYGFSQGAWAAAVAAARDQDIAFLATVGCSGVSPAAQMRFYTDELLRRAGYGEEDRHRLRELRLAFEEVLRGEGDRDSAATMLAAATKEPWFELAFLGDELPEDSARWPDMDFDPEPVFARVRCPVLIADGEDEECSPAPASKAAWRRAAEASGAELTVVDLPGCGHFPAAEGDGTSLDVPISAFSMAYTQALEEWFAAR